MEHKEAADVLIKMLDKYKFPTEEKEAVLAAVGVLAWTLLSKARMKSLKAKRGQKNEWKK